MFANQQVFDPQSSWIELFPPQLGSITTIENPNDADQWTLSSESSDQAKLAFGLTTNDAGHIINEIMMSALLTCQNKNDPTRRVVKNVLWRRKEINASNRFGSGWELVSLNSENQAPGLVTSLAIGSFDQTEAIKEEQRKAAEGKKAEQAQKLAKNKAANKAKKEKDAKKRKEEEKRWDAAQKRKQDLSPAGQ
jgi:hypothetical protein